MADYKDKNEVLIETEQEDSDFVEEEGEATTCIIQTLLCNQKNSDTTQRHQILYSIPLPPKLHKGEEPKFIFICNWSKFLVESKETK